MLAVTEDGNVLVCAQPRAGSNQRYSLECPAGLVDPGETTEEAALRELREETGYEPKTLIRLREMHGDPACCTSLTTLFLATGCKRVGEQKLDSDEVLERFEVSWDEFAELVEGEVIYDANTSLAYFASLRYMDRA